MDWRKPNNHGCNARWNPSGASYYDGIDLDPLEVMFVKMKSYTSYQQNPMVLKADKYTQWKANKGQDSKLITSNDYLANPAKYKAARIMLAQARGSQCFDYAYYVVKNPDLKLSRVDNTRIWQQFVYSGQFEQRKARFSCDADYSAVMKRKVQ